MNSDKKDMNNKSTRTGKNISNPRFSIPYAKNLYNRFQKLDNDQNQTLRK